MATSSLRLFYSRIKQAIYGSLTQYDQQATSTKNHIVQLIAAFIAGLFGTLSFAPFSLWLALFITISAAVWLLSAASSIKHSFQYGFLLGLGFFGSGVSWVYVSIVQYGQVGVVLSVLATLLFVSVLAVFYGIALCLAWQLKHRYPHLPLALVLTISLLITEFLRSTLFTGFPWLLLGYGLHHTWLFELSAIGGIWLLTLLAILTFSLPASLMLTKKQRDLYTSSPNEVTNSSLTSNKNEVKHTLATHSIILLMLFVAWGAGFYLSQSPVQWTTKTGTLKTTLIQGNVPQDQKWLPSNAKNNLDFYLETSFQHLDSDLIVWPETAITYLYNDINPYISGFNDVFKETNTSLVTGIPLVQNNGRQSSFYNAVWATGNGDGIYLKQHLVPFGEYVPFQDYIGKVLDIFGIPLESFESGTADQVLLQVNSHSLATFICYEVVYPQIVRKMVADSDLMLTVSNDAWFGDSIGPWQHLEMAQFRAKESGRYLLRGTNTGVTAVIDSEGKIADLLPQFTRTTLTAEVDLMTGATPYIQYGNLSAFLFLVTLLLAQPLLSPKRQPKKA